MYTLYMCIYYTSIEARKDKRRNWWKKCKIEILLEKLSMTEVKKQTGWDFVSPTNLGGHG